jgi:hypothetical protein
MATRSFRDHDGVEWQVWEVSPGEHHGGPATSAGGYLPPDMADGWLCFEGPAGKRRLFPVPARWPEHTEAELDGLRLAAEPVVARPSRTARG